MFSVKKLPLAHYTLDTGKDWIGFGFAVLNEKGEIHTDVVKGKTALDVYDRKSTAVKVAGALNQEPECKHPATRIYSWFAYDGTLCAACCDCGKVLAGGA